MKVPCNEFVKQRQAYATLIRRALHSMPELSDVEYNTSELIFGKLCELGFRPTRIHTGMYIDICGTSKQSSKKRICFRADFDGLPIVEKTGLPFASKNGCMHACGHDAHTAMVLTVAMILKDYPPKHDVRLLFQFGEEGTGGAERMIEAGAIDNVDAIFALHMCPELTKGKIGSRVGALFAGVVEFDVDFKGKASHIADRSRGIDALTAAAEFITEMRKWLQMQGALIGQAGKAQAGSARNIVPDSAHLECTLRYFDAAAMNNGLIELEKIIAKINKSAGTMGSLTKKVVYPPVINDNKAYEAFKIIASKTTEIVDFPPKYTAEDFGFYLEKVPGVMSWLGCLDTEHSSPLHSDTFDFDESVMMTGIDVYLNIANNLKFD